MCWVTHSNEVCRPQCLEACVGNVASLACEKALWKPVVPGPGPSGSQLPVPLFLLKATWESQPLVAHTECPGLAVEPVRLVMFSAGQPLDLSGNHCYG